MKDRPAYRSYSQLTEWMKCGESFRLTRRIGIKEQPSVWLPGGTAFHNTSEHIDHDTLYQESIKQTWLSEWRAAVQAQIDSAPDEYKDPADWRVAGRGKETMAWWEEQGAKWAQMYADWRTRSGLTVFVDGDRVLIEAELMPILGDVPVKMYPDRIMVDQHGQLLVVDIKTGASEQPSSLQLGVYKVGVEKLLGLPVEWGAFYNARKGELTPPVRLDQWTEERIGALFATFDKQERAGEYLPNIGSHCKYMCSVRKWCVYQGGTPHPEDE
jgi:putative RecB family exonuclease